MKIITNNTPRDLVSLADLPEHARADFNYIEADEEHSPRMFRYRGNWYDVSEFVRVSADMQELKGWDGYATDTYFSGTAVRIVEDGEQVIVGRFST